MPRHFWLANFNPEITEFKVTANDGEADTANRILVSLRNFHTSLPAHGPVKLHLLNILKLDGVKMVAKFSRRLSGKS